MTNAYTRKHTHTAREGEQSASISLYMTHLCAQFDREPHASSELRVIIKVRERERSADLPH